MPLEDVDRSFVSLPSPTGRRNGAGYMPCQGLYHTAKGTRPRTAFIATHYNVDFSEHYLGEFLARRGYGFLGWNTRFRGAEAYFMLEHALIDIGVGVRWLRESAGVEQVVLLGNSGGGSLMAAYQSQAVAPNLEPVAGGAIPQAATELVPADLYISLNAHPGRPEVLTSWMDPSVVDENDPVSADSTLDMYAPENGPPYSPEFVARYRAAQEARNHRITAWASSELLRLQSHDMFDRVFTLPRTWADLRLMDGSLDPSERPVGRCYAGDPRWANYSPFGIGFANTLRTWLSMWSLETSGCRGAPHLRRIEIPALVIQSLADTGVFPSDAVAIHEHLASPDKRLDRIPGDHYLEDPVDARDEVADRIAAWVTERTG
jgi:pimeloyl-ACP methyl ester carboxylesterase